MSQKTIIKYSFLHAVGAAVYIALVAGLITNVEKLFGKADSLFGVMAFLLVFVISAAVMGLTIFGRPVMWYLNGSKKEAVALSFYTIGFLILIAVIVFLFLVIKN